MNSKLNEWMNEWMNEWVLFNLLSHNSYFYNENKWMNEWQTLVNGWMANISAKLGGNQCIWQMLTHTHGHSLNLSFLSLVYLYRLLYHYWNSDVQFFVCYYTCPLCLWWKFSIYNVCTLSEGTWTTWDGESIWVAAQSAEPSPWTL